MSPRTRVPSRRGLRWPALAAGLALLAAASTPAATQVALPADLGSRLLADYLQPQSRRLQASTVKLHQAVQAYCARPAGPTRRGLVGQRLQETVEAWARFEFLRFGPLTGNNRLENFFFWPDPRGVMQRQLRGLLAAADPAPLENAGLRQQSAAVQGLPALEYALYADDAPALIAAGDAAGRYRCAFATAVAANMTALADEIAAGWKRGAPMAEEFARPSADRAVYRDTAEVATETLKALSLGLEAMREQKLVPALGESPEQARGALLPLWRSGLTKPFLAAGVAGLRDFYVASHLGTVLPADARWMDAAVRDELQRLLADFQALQMPVDQALNDATQRDLLVHAQLLLRNLRSIVDENLAPALNVNLGFNSLDGD